MKNEYLTPRRNFLFNKQAADGVPGGGPIPASQGNPVILFGEFELSEDNTDEDYFTLLNPNTFAVDLSGWQIKGDVAMTFRAGTVIPANSAIYVSPRVASFRARLEPPTGGQGLLVIGDYKGVLYNPDWLFLFDAGGNPVQQP
jgi:hypothetical protein